MPLEDEGAPGSRRATMSPGAPSSMLGPTYLFGSLCFFVFGVIYLQFVGSWYMFLSNWLFGTLGAASWFLLRRAPDSVRGNVFLAIVYVGLVNVAVHLGQQPLPMVAWGMSVAIAAAFVFNLPGVLTWGALCVGFYPLTAWLKGGPLAERVIPLSPAQFELLSVATYCGLLSFLTYSFVLFRRGLQRALAGLRQSAEALRQSESLLAESQRVARIGSYAIDLRQGSWTSSTMLDELLAWDGSSRRDLAGWLEQIHPDDRAEVERGLRPEALDGQTSFDREYRLARQELGQELWVHGRGAVTRDAAGEPVRMVGTIQDVTRQKQREQERREMEAQLSRAQKLESLGVLAGGIAHDFNNLLTGILGNIELARQRSVAPDERDRLLRNAETATVRAAELTRQMLAFSGKGQFVIQPLDLNAVLSEMVELLQASIPKRATMRLELDPRVPRILADASQIRQVVMNLILNAAEAIGSNSGVVTLRTERRSVDARQLAVGLSAEDLPGGAYACLEIADTGCGMDEETKARIFDPFFTTKFTGRGLGLAATLGIVRGHRGAIWLTSAPGQGTTFTLLFPAAPTQQTTSEQRAPAPPVEAGGASILVVDDEGTVREIAQSILQTAGLRVLAAEDGDLGVELLRTQGAAVDLVLLDLTMPRMDGVTAFAEIRRLRPELPVVLMSGYSRANVANLFPGAAPDDFLEKPFQVEELLCAVSEALRRRGQGQPETKGRG